MSSVSHRSDPSLVGRSVTVSAPATSANLGPGFDHLGLALGLRQTACLRVVDTDSTVDVSGEGADSVPHDGSHLIIRSATAALGELGLTVPGIALTARNVIPLGRGLGSSAAAIVAGVLAATALAGRPVDRGWVARRAAEIEGHADNVAAAVYGGLVIAYPGSKQLEIAGIAVHPELRAVVYLPEAVVSTAEARGLLPETVRHSDAAANSGRAALLVEALSRRPELLLDATADRLHQPYRRPAMPASYELLESLRNKGFAAMISGAGPSLLVLGRSEQLGSLPEPVGFRRLPLGIGSGARVDHASLV